MCSGRVFAVTADVASQSRLQSGRRQLFWQGAFWFLCNFLVSCQKTFTQEMWRCVRIELNQLTSELKRCSSPLARAWLRCATTSRHQESAGTLTMTTVLWFDRHDMAKQWHNAARKQAGLQTHRMLWPDRRRHDSSKHSKVEMTQTTAGTV